VLASELKRWRIPSPGLAVYKTVVGISKLSVPHGSVGFYQEAGTDWSAFAVISLWGKFGGLHACGATFPYMVPLPNIFLTRLFSKTEIEKEGLPRDSPAGLGAGGPEFKSRRPDQNISRVFFSLLNAPFTEILTVEIRQTGGLDSQIV